MAGKHVKRRPKRKKPRTRGGIFARRQKAKSCYYCRRELTDKINHGTMRTIDHYRPRCRNKGLTVLTNAVIACLRCNNLKGDLEPEVYMAYVNSGPLPEFRCRKRR